MDPVSAIANGLGSIFQFLTLDKATRTRSLPPWMRPPGDSDKRANLVIIGGMVILIALVVAIVITLKKKAN